MAKSEKDKKEHREIMLKYATEHQVECAWCKKMFIPIACDGRYISNAKYCSAECSIASKRELTKKQYREKQKRKRERMERLHNNNGRLTVAQISAMAKAAGMDYGYYVAVNGL